MQIAQIPEALAWSDGGAGIDELQSLYRSTLAERLGAILGRLQAKQPEFGGALAELLRGLPDPAFERLLTAPETSYRLLWPGRHTIDDVAAFLLNAARAECARLGRPLEAPKTALWTALGDFCLQPDGHSAAAPTISGVLSLDFHSSNARDLSRAASVASDYGAEARYGDDDCARLTERMTSVSAAIEAASPDASQFVQRFTKVVIFVQGGGPQGGRFLSRSPERHIGLTVIVNGHRPDLDDVDLAEALVHEAIHSLVDTYETLANVESDPAAKWIRSDALYDGRPRAISPWTRTRLVVPTYVHACFVWYGLVRFWSRALGSRAFPIGRVLDRLRAAVRGFLSDDMLDQLVPYQDSFHPQLMTTLTAMRADIMSAFDAAAPGRLAS